jgi:heme-degrading monooxygenase HmoA
MIRHIVSWKLTPQDAEGKAAAVADMAAALEPLVGVVPGLISLTVRGNVVFPERNWDVVLISEFESVDALKGYRVHPAHEEAAKVPRRYAAESATVDIEV